MAAILPGVTIAATITATYLEKLASDLNYNQSIHPNDKISININTDLFYTIGVWHD